MKLVAIGFVLLTLATTVSPAEKARRPPIIDVHLHAYGPQEWKQPRPNPVTGAPAPTTSEAHMRATLAAMERHNIVMAVVSGPLDAVKEWLAAAPGRLVGSPLFGEPDLDYWGHPLPGLDSLRALYIGGQLGAMAEVTAQYAGLSPSDPSLEPYFGLAEELDIPVGFHTGTSFPRTPYECCPKFRVSLGNPLLLEDLLVRHPRLRVYIMHGGEPWRQETLALLHMYPQVYVDVAVINWISGPKGRPRFHQYLKEMLDHGYGKRLMFGSDQMRWPEAIDMAIQSVESAPFLTEEQKRDIMYYNAARFFRLEAASSAK